MMKIKEITEATMSKREALRVLRNLLIDGKAKIVYLPCYASPEAKAAAHSLECRGYTVKQ